MSSQLIYCAICGAANDVGDAHCFACQGPLDAARAASTDASLLQGRYRLLEQLGAGGFGAVYRAEDCEQPGLPLAIKQINLRDLSARQIIEATETFSRERATLSTLNHTHLPRLHATFEDAEHWYLVIDYFPGESLETYLNAQARLLPSAVPERARVEELLRCGLSLCEVLEYLHTRTPPVIFRDLKPGNVIRVSAETYALIDFGIARTFKPGQAKDTIPLGSPGYAAPEQYGKAQTDERADIYSLGAILHQMLTGYDPSESPFSFSTPNYTDPALCRLEILILRMVALKPGDRPASVGEVARELRAIEEAYQQPGARIWLPQPGQTPPTLLSTNGNGATQLQFQIPLTPGQRQKQARQQARAARRPISRRKVLIGGAIAGGLVIGGGALADILAHKLNSGPQMIWSPGGSTLTEMKQVAWSSDSRYLVTIGQDNQRVGRLLLWDMQQQHAIWESALIGQASAQSFAWNPKSADASSPLFALAYDRLLSFKQIDHGKLAEFSTFNPGMDASLKPTIPITAIQWSPYGTHMAIVMGLDVLIWDIAGGKVSATYRGHEKESSNPTQKIMLQWSPDSSHIASVLASSQDAPAHIWNPVNGAAVTKTEMNPPQLNGINYLQWSPDSVYLAFGNADALLSYVNFYDLKHQRTFRLPLENSTTFWGVQAQMSLVAWEPQGTSLLTFYSDTNGNGYIQIWNSADSFENLPSQITNVSTSMIVINQQFVIGVSWSPNGRYILAACMSNDESTYTLNLYDPAPLNLSATINFPGALQGMNWSPDGSKLLAWGLDNSTHNALFQMYSV